ncbi:MAG TPA: hypothetical protein VK436_04380 [Methanocella sp.]|nr:hypothetical protein [Methanocella sp.]
MAYPDDLFRGQVIQALLTCDSAVFHYLWASYSDLTTCPIEDIRRRAYSNRTHASIISPEVMGLILNNERRW